MLDAGFVETLKNEAGSMLELDCDATPPASDVVSIVVDDLKLPPQVALSMPPGKVASDEVGQSRHAVS
jgi:hypothetical protein